jgi:hypothetical protein
MQLVAVQIPCTMHTDCTTCVMLGNCGSHMLTCSCVAVQVPSYVFVFWLCLGVCLASAPIAYGTALRVRPADSARNIVTYVRT